MMITARTSDLLRETKLQLEIFEEEAESLAIILLEEVLKISRTNILLNSTITLSEEHQARLGLLIDQLQENIPIQHLLGKTEFYGRTFEVNNHVLIPRQETEELINNVSKRIISDQYSRILDIGTGSGCIAISLALDHLEAKVSGLDVSEKALEVAQRNSINLGADIHWINKDILSYTTDLRFDLIVSNPPYVLDSEKKEMNKNVTEHEPALALYVEDTDPLVYYREITAFANNNLEQNGLLYFEINERFGEEVAEILKSSDYHQVKIEKDLNGKNRFVSGTRK